LTEMQATRDAYGRALIELGARRDDLIVLDADLSRSTRTEWFQQAFPERFINVGIAEQNLIGMAAGLALGGMLPFATTYAIFIARALDQIRQAVAFPRLNVKIVATHAGLAASHDGGSHQGTEDVALMRAIPGMTVIAPCDYESAYQAVLAMADYPGPVYMRLQKEASPVITARGTPFEIGRVRLLREGSDVALAVYGTLVPDALEAATRLADHSISTAVLDVATIKPLDVVTLLSVAEKVHHIVTIEEHSVTGGLRDAVAVACSGLPVRVDGIGLEDTFGESGPWLALRHKYGMDADGIVAFVSRQLAATTTPPTGDGHKHAQG